MREARLIAALAAALLALPAARAASEAPPAAPVAEENPDTWLPIAPGADRMTLTLADGATAALIRFDLDLFRAEVVVGKGSPPQPRTAAELRRGRGAVAAVNGGFFDEHAVPLGLRIAGGDQRFNLRAKADWGVLLLGGHRARIIHTREYVAAAPPAKGAPPSPVAGSGAAGAPGTATNVPPVSAASSAALPGPVEGAIQVGPRLIAGGVPFKLKPQLARRTGVALDRDGRMLTLVVATDPIDASDLALRLAKAGFDSALLLDGGPSTQLSLELGPAHGEIVGGYPVPDLLAVFTRHPARRSPAPAGSTENARKAPPPRP